MRHFGFVIYLIAAIGLLWLVQDALDGWEYVVAVVAILAIYMTGMFDGSRMERGIH